MWRVPQLSEGPVAHAGSGQGRRVAYGMDVPGWRWQPCWVQKTSILVYVSCIFWEDVSAGITSVMPVGVRGVGQERPYTQPPALLGKCVLGAERLGHR